MKNILSKTIIALLACIAVAASAADLTQAKRDGLVGERADGYLGLVDQSASVDIKALVREVNAKREAEYHRIAKANNLSIEQVQALAGKKTIEITERGQWILINGGWQRK